MYCSSLYVMGSSVTHLCLIPSGPLCPCVHLIYHLAMIGQEGPDSNEPIKIRRILLVTVSTNNCIRWHLTPGSVTSFTSNTKMGQH